MKKKLTQLCLIIAIGMMSFSCQSDEQQVAEPTLSEVQLTLQEQAANEDAAFAELFAEIDALNAEYIELSETNNNQRGVIGGPIKRVAIVAACDVMGGFAGAAFGPWGAGVGAVAASFWAAKNWKHLDQFDIKTGLFFFSSNSAYLSSCNPDIYDELGMAHNKAINNMVNSYSTTNLNTMPYTQLQPIFLSAFKNSGYISMPPDFLPQTSYSIMEYTKNLLETNNFNAIQAIEYMAACNPSLYNNCMLLKSYLTAVDKVSDDNLTNYHINFRKTVESSNISVSSKETIRTCISVGLASSNLWYDK